jgi:hypothetical protein
MSRMSDRPTPSDTLVLFGVTGTSRARTTYGKCWVSSVTSGDPTCAYRTSR